MSIKPKTCYRAGLTCLPLLLYYAGGSAQSASPLDVNQHPPSPRYESLFDEGVLPLDTELSWKNRFSGNEYFNTGENLPPTSPAIARQLGDSSDGERDGASTGKFDATGVVRLVKASEGKIKVEHGPIERLGMPAMTMLFRVDDPAQMAGLEKGSEIEFDVANTAAGFTITRLMPASGDADRPYDARGKVTSIRAGQGKVKIEHGPIERLGIPAMTMLFKLARPQDLQALEVGMPIEFDVRNSAAGFEITRFRTGESDSESGGTE